MTSSIIVTPKRHLLARKHVVWAIKRENRSNGSTWARAREKKRKDRTGHSKKPQRRYISPTRGETPTEPIFAEICTVVAVPDVITCANFWTEIIRGYDFTAIEFPIFLLILAWALQQCSANALPVIIFFLCPLPPIWTHHRHVEQPSLQVTRWRTNHLQSRCHDTAPSYLAL